MHGERSFFIGSRDWKVALENARTLDAHLGRPPGTWPYVWVAKRQNLILRWFDYAIGRISAEKGATDRVRCSMRIIGCTGEIGNPAVYERLMDEFRSELLGGTKRC